MSYRLPPTGFGLGLKGKLGRCMGRCMGGAWRGAWCGAWVVHGMGGWVAGGMLKFSSWCEMENYFVPSPVKVLQWKNRPKPFMKGFGHKTTA